MRAFFGTVFANDKNGRVVDIPAGAQIIKVSDMPGKSGGGMRIDFLLPLLPPMPEPVEYDDSTYGEQDALKSAIDAEIERLQAESETE